jgi:hypothetical protein
MPLEGCTSYTACMNIADLRKSYERDELDERLGRRPDGAVPALV